MISITIGSQSITRNKREKGKSLTIIPKDYTVIDLETTGLDPRYDEVIEIGAIKVRNYQEIDRFQTLIKPNMDISQFITDITGITNKMVSTAPIIDEVLPSLLDFVDKDIILGHNVHFDINFLYDILLNKLDYKFSNDLVDLLRLARRVYPDFKNHKLKTVATNLGVDVSGSHRSMKDCEITHNCFIKLGEYVDTKNIDMHSLFATKNSSKSLNLNDIKATTHKFDKDHILFNKNCVFTGKLEKMIRKEAAQLVVDLGGKCQNGVTKTTNFLILGNFDYNATIKDGKSSKLKKAEKLILNGQDLLIISEDVFYDLL